MASITYRALDADGEPQWGQGQADFLEDLEAVGQAILTRLRLFQGEWWSDLLDGTPYWQSILGASGADANIKAVTQLLTQRILDTPFVQPGGISSLQTSFDSTTRTFNFFAIVNTQFGAVTVSNMPTPPPQGLP